mmetsp:Transcript_12838/g.40999  ORF Transcript_12838/g.40999 Transcript_12838/m.40999 type:complete len:244 (+) Transcript_12838:297-1028(+)
MPLVGLRAGLGPETPGQRRWLAAALVPRGRPAADAMQCGGRVVVWVEEAVDPLVNQRAVDAREEVEKDRGGHVVVPDALLNPKLQAGPAVPRVEVAAEREIRRREHAVGEIGDGHVEQRHDQHKHLERVKDRHVAGEPVEMAQLRKRPRQQQQRHLRDGARDGANHHEHDEGGREARVEPAALPREQAELDERVLAVDPPLVRVAEPRRVDGEQAEKGAADVARDERRGPRAHKEVESGRQQR